MGQDIQRKEVSQIKKRMEIIVRLFKRLRITEALHSLMDAPIAIEDGWLFSHFRVRVERFSLAPREREFLRLFWTFLIECPWAPWPPSSFPEHIFFWNTISQKVDMC